jgi:hypothetical protein
MKNIYILPTDKPSRLHLWTDEKGTRLELCELVYSHTRNTQHLYITSDEEIKRGDWVIQSNFEKTNTQLIQCINEFQVKLANDKDGSFTKKKIILTTDGDLIKDGVQKIDDEFIEWFVNNPRCEWVEVKKEMYMPFDGKVPFELSLDQSLNTCPHYKIITKDYLQGFIDLHNNELEHWDAVEFLEWLKLNDFKIVKK